MCKTILEDGHQRTIRSGQDDSNSRFCPDLGVKIKETIGIRLQHNLRALQCNTFLIYSYQYSWKWYMCMVSGHFVPSDDNFISSVDHFIPSKSHFVSL